MDTDKSDRTRRGRARGFRNRLPLVKGSLALTAAVALAGIITVAAVLIHFCILRDLPRITSLMDYRPLVVTTVYAEDARKVGELFTERRKVIALDQMSRQLKLAFLAAEDSRFYEHKGIDLTSILRAFLKNIKHGAIVQGGSTITQQVAKTFFLSPERSLKRKLKEAVLAWRLERYLNKDEILHLYLNQIYLGEGAYGVEAAAETYFGKSTRDLSLAECAVLAGLPQAPSRYSPYQNPDRTRERQLYVLNRMVECGYITNEEASHAVATPLVYRGPKDPTEEASSYFLQAVRQYLTNRYGEKIGLGSGLRVYTSLNVEMQRMAAAAVDVGARTYDKRHGFRGAQKRVKPEEIATFCAAALAREGGKLARGRIFSAVVLQVAPERVLVRVGPEEAYMPLKDPAWGGLHPEQFSAGDVLQVRWLGEDKGVRLEQKPEVQAALVALEPGCGAVRALVGGTDYENSQFNRATQSRRQAGSAFKPVIYAAALEKGYTPTSVIIDAPVDLQGTGEDTKWNPKNFEGDYYGPTLFRTGLIRSRNVVTVKILKDIGVDYVADYSRRLGITSHLNKDLSLALGSSGVSLLELTAAYAAFDNGGRRISPLLVTRVEDSSGKVLERNEPQVTQAMDPAAACVMNYLLREVVDNGTGWRARRLGRPAAGKTGTTNNYIDAWFVGFTPSLVAGVWIGFDNQQRSLGKGETGGLAAAPMWAEFMARAQQGRPIETFPVVPGVVFARIDPRSGLLAATESEDGIFECFKEGTAPTEQAPPPRQQEQEDFFRQDGGEQNPAGLDGDEEESGKWSFP
ncbi:MAG: PBP1A family penicillin-binding protein [Pseudomonadota bacterium]